MLHFLKFLKHDNFAFGDFKNDNLKDHQYKTNYGNLLPALGLDFYTFEPTRVTVKYKS